MNKTFILNFQINIIIFFTIGLIPNIVYSQKNLVYNGSFEEYYYCPCELNKIDTIACKGWWSPNDATPDYLNKCWVNKTEKYFCEHRYRELASYTQKTGDGYMGLALIGVKYFWMEHIQSHLLEPLEAGKRYKVSFWVRLAYKHSDYATYNIGLYFSKDPDIVGKKYNVSSYLRYMTPELRAHIKNPGGNFITDTNWVEISGIYTAQGGEQYITIGMFWDDTPAIVEAYNKCKENNTTNNQKLLSKAIKNNLLAENKNVYKSMYEYIRRYYKYFKPEMKIPYYLIDDVSVVKLEE
jgi:hypothetical protein